MIDVISAETSIIGLRTAHLSWCAHLHAWAGRARILREISNRPGRVQILWGRTGPRVGPVLLRGQSGVDFQFWPKAVTQALDRHEGDAEPLAISGRSCPRT